MLFRSVFDYRLDTKSNRFESWDVPSAIIHPSLTSSSSASLYSTNGYDLKNSNLADIFVSTSESRSVTFWADHLIEKGTNVMLTGTMHCWHKVADNISLRISSYTFMSFSCLISFYNCTYFQFYYMSSFFHLFFCLSNDLVYPSQSIDPSIDLSIRLPCRLFINLSIHISAYLTVSLFTRVRPSCLCISFPSLSTSYYL